MQDNINPLLKQLYNQLKQQEMIRFPDSNQIKYWDEILAQWMHDNELPLFARRTTSLRGSLVINQHNLTIVQTDNTPAHWVFRKLFINNEQPVLNDIKKLWQTNTFPLAMMIKKSEKEFLKPTHAASKEFRLGNDDWKIAHIKPIALPRRLHLTADEFRTHHYLFLSLSNMYLIKKEFSGLAEVRRFNDIIMEERN